MPNVQILWYGRLMADFAWSDLFVLWPLLIGTHIAAIALGHRIAQRTAWREEREALERQGEVHAQHIAAIEERYGIDANILFGVRFNYAQTEH